MRIRKGSSAIEPSPIINGRGEVISFVISLSGIVLPALGGLATTSYLMADFRG
jgi:hypothetical protein